MQPITFIDPNTNNPVELKELLERIKNLPNDELKPQTSKGITRIQSGLVVQAFIALETKIDHDHAWAFTTEFNGNTETIRLLDINDNILYEEEYE